MLLHAVIIYVLVHRWRGKIAAIHNVITMSLYLNKISVPSGTNGNSRIVNFTTTNKRFCVYLTESLKSHLALLVKGYHIRLG